MRKRVTAGTNWYLDFNYKIPDFDIRVLILHQLIMNSKQVIREYIFLTSDAG